jgi:hypothetical protein
MNEILRAMAMDIAEVKHQRRVAPKKKSDPPGRSLVPAFLGFLKVLKADMRVNPQPVTPDGLVDSLIEVVREAASTIPCPDARDALLARISIDRALWSTSSQS